MLDGALLIQRNLTSLRIDGNGEDRLTCAVLTTNRVTHLGEDHLIAGGCIHQTAKSTIRQLQGIAQRAACRGLAVRAVVNAEQVIEESRCILF